ncbi:hypothetical protein EPH_0020300 [Eimeria praecox]|uniref:Uncharacterized protein n=1 Tax=Eimeria praecox TaxID=51316 RepID=U6H3T1_9EIME|nr:hypothetical protein EPH_0020300 [Eimeria praecox]
MEPTVHEGEEGVHKGGIQCLMNKGKLGQLGEKGGPEVNLWMSLRHLLNQEAVDKLATEVRLQQITHTDRHPPTSHRILGNPSESRDSRQTGDRSAPAADHPYGPPPPYEPPDSWEYPLGIFLGPPPPYEPREVEEGLCKGPVICGSHSYESTTVR